MLAVVAAVPWDGTKGVDNMGDCDGGNPTDKDDEWCTGCGGGVRWVVVVVVAVAAMNELDNIMGDEEEDVVVVVVVVVVVATKS